MKNKNILPIVTMLLVSIAMVGAIFITNNLEKKDNQKDTAEIKDNNNNQKENNNKEINNSNNSNNSNKETESDKKSNSITGKYQRFENTDNHYVENNLTFTNQTTSSIDFEIIAGEGRDVDHVSVGELKGTAKLIDNIPQDAIIPESTQYAYQYVENIDEKDYRITFVYTAHKKSIYITIIEDYPDNFNPYGGHGVHFSGEYEKIVGEK